MDRLTLVCFYAGHRTTASCSQAAPVLKPYDDRIYHSWLDPEEFGVAQTSFQLDPGTAEAIERLKGVFGVSSNTAVIRKAIALSRVAAQAADSADNTVTIVDNAGERFKVPLNG